MTPVAPTSRQAKPGKQASPGLMRGGRWLHRSAMLRNGAATSRGTKRAARLRLTLLVLVAVFAMAVPQAALACDQNGIGKAAPGTRKAGLNILKNRRIAPTIVNPVRSSDMLSYPNRDDPALEASDGMVLRGQLLQAVREGAESPNCGARYDYHIFIGPIDGGHPQGAALTKGQVRSRKKRAVVVELTPNLQDLHPDWGPNLQRELAGRNVCVTGWLLFDYEHPPQLGHTRGTLWELHPVTGIALLQPDGSCTAWTP